VRDRVRRARWATEERLRDRLETAEDRRLLEVARGGRDVCWTDEGEAEPLVTVRIATYNRGRLVAERALATAVAQTYERLEILVVGDACDDETVAAVESVGDPRIRFVNLGARGIYPDHVRWRRMVAGSAPMNAALALAKGSWIAPCDDDDELTPDHVEVLLDHARRHRLEMVYSRARAELWPDDWYDFGSEPLRKGGLTHGSVLYTAGLRFMRHSNTSWKMLEPSDWNLWKRMDRIGVRIGFCDHLTYIHYLGAVRRASELGESP
jgi:glycosyltransferase involved in cell wall biosynthesis